MYDRMRSLCNERGISVARLERAADIANGTIWKWQKQTPTIGTLDKVSKALGMGIVELMDYLNLTGRGERNAPDAK